MFESDSPTCATFAICIWMSKKSPGVIAVPFAVKEATFEVSFFCIVLYKQMSCLALISGVSKVPMLLHLTFLFVSACSDRQDPAGLLNVGLKNCYPFLPPS